MIIKLSLPNTCIPSIHFRKIDMTTKNSGDFIRFPHSVHPPPPLSAGGRVAVELLSNYKKGRLAKMSIFRGVAGKQGGLQFLHKNKLKFEIYNCKKRLKTKIVFSVTDRPSCFN